MKIRIEQSEDPKDEIVITCGAGVDAERIKRAVADALNGGGAIPLRLGRTECFVPLRDLLFFETQGDGTAAHTADNMYNTALRLCEIELMLPRTFVKASRSCIVNTARISSVERNLTGPSEIEFSGTRKKTYVSRKYYKSLIEIIKETRLSR